MELSNIGGAECSASAKTWRSGMEADSNGSNCGNRGMARSTLRRLSVPGRLGCGASSAGRG